MIFCHARPDGDTLSSAFSLKYALNKLGIVADVVCQDTVPEKFYPLGYFTFSEQTLDKYDASISVDCASEQMIGSLYSRYTKNALTINIDHHISNTRYAKYNFVKDECANAVNVYNLIVELNVEIDEKLADMLYVGIMTDSGNFTQSNTDATSLFVASELMKKGANPYRTYDILFKSQSYERSKLYLDTMQKMRFYHDGKLAIIYVMQADLDKYNLKKEVTEGFVTYPLTISGVEVAVSILQKSDKSFKISFRSKNHVDVNEIALLYGGGGHKMASGAVINGYFEDVIDKLVFNIGNYL